MKSYARGDIGPEFASTYRLPIPQHAPFAIGYTFEDKPHHYLPDVVGTLTNGQMFIAKAGMEDDKRGDRNLAKAEAARRLAYLQQGTFWISTERTLTKRRHCNLVALHARRKTFPPFADIARGLASVCLREKWPRSAQPGRSFSGADAREWALHRAWEGRPLLLLTTTDAKSGRRRTHPLMYLRDDGRLLVFASTGGAPTNPDWYYNLLAHPELTVEVGNETYDAIATPVTGEERDRIYARWAQMYPQYGEYQRNTTRKIPVIALQRRKG